MFYLLPGKDLDSGLSPMFKLNEASGQIDDLEDDLYDYFSKDDSDTTYVDHFSDGEKRDMAYQRQLFTRKGIFTIPNTAYPSSAICQYKVNDLAHSVRHPTYHETPPDQGASFPFNYPTRRLTIDEMLAKFIDEGKRKHEEMEIFIKEFRTTNELLLKTRSNLLRVTTRRGKMTSEATRSKEINETGINMNEPPRFEQDMPKKPHDDGEKNKSSSIRERTTQPLVKPQLEVDEVVIARGDEVEFEKRITNDFKGVPHPLSGDYTPTPQEEIDESLYVYGKKGPQEPEPNVSDDRSSEYSTCQSNDSAGSIGTSSEHSVDPESEISSVPPEVYVSTPITTNEKGVSDPKSKEVEPSCVSHIKTPRQPIKDQATPKVNRKNWNAMMERELGEGYSFTKKKCFVCGSLSHLIKDCDYYEKKMAREAEVKKQRVFNTSNGVAKPVWTNANRVNHSNKFVPRSVQLNDGRPNINSVRPNINTGRTNINSVRPNINTGRTNINSVRPNINTGRTNVNPVRPIVNTGSTNGNTVRSRQPVPNKTSNSFSPKRPQVNQFNQRGHFSKSYSSVRRPFAKTTTQMSHSHAVKGNWGSAVKTSAGYNWRNSKPNSNCDSGPTFIRTINAKDHPLKNMVDRGGSVTFGGSKGYISGKGKIRVGNLDFDSVSFVKELGHFNLFSISQICDKQHKVLFTETECLVVSSDFKMPDENQVLLKVPRHHNMYSFDMRTPTPAKSFACLIAKATSDESRMWHRRLGHINFKNLNKLVKGNLVRGLPSKVFRNDHTCVACHKGKQHRASCKAKLERLITKPLHTLHMDLFGPTSVKSINHASYCLVITDDCTRFSWVFFLASKDETSGILQNFIRQIENQLNHRVKIIRSDNGTEFKNRDMLEFCGNKGIKQEYSNARTPQQNGKQLVLLAIFLIGVLGKFDGKSDEGFLVGYSLNSKAYRVYNLVTKRVEVNLHVNFLEDKPNVKGVGYRWMFDIDYLTDSMNYIPVSLENQANPHAGASEVTNSAGTSQTPICNASEEKDEDVELIVVPSTVKNTEEKVKSRTSSTNSKKEEILTEPQQEKKVSSTDTSEDNPKILAFRRELEEIALKHLGTVSENNSTSTPSVNTGNESVNTGRLDPDDSTMTK
ncbi:putative ribonuclease H-like domain-containing protein, partial [Tanacetum coccineum]